MSELLDAELKHEKDPRAALRHLLVAFRASRHPGLAELIERLSEALLKPLEGLPPKITERGEALTRLIRESTVDDRGPVLVAFKEYAVGVQVGPLGHLIDAWAELEEDPRIATMAVELLTRRGRVRELSANVRRGLHRCIEKSGHEGLLTALEPWLIPHEGHGQSELAPISEPFIQRSRRLVEKVKKQRKASAVDDPAALARLDALIPKRMASAVPSATALVDGAALRAAIYAAPDDDAPRLTWADWLSEQGDPRGEFVVLQIARSRGRVTPAARAREAELLTLHRSRFLGALEPHLHLKGLRFDRGFLARCEFSSDPPLVPELELLEDVTFTWRVEQPTLERFRRLRKVHGGSVEMLLQLLTIAPNLMEARLGHGEDIERLATAPRSLQKLALYTSRPPPAVLPAIFRYRVIEAADELELSIHTAVSNAELHLPPPPLFAAETLDLAPRSLQRFILIPNWNLKLEWSRGATGFDRLRCTIDDSGIDHSFLLRRALAGFAHRPLERVELKWSRDHRPPAFLDSVRHTAKEFVFDDPK